MYIKSLRLGDYRNYESLDIDFHPNINIIYGENAQGKTNILEALLVAGTTTSHRGSKDKEIINKDKDEAHIRMNITKEDISHRIDMHLKKNKTKGIAIDGIPIRRTSELLGMVNIVIFSPEDLRIVKNGPSERRRFMNMELCQIDGIYYHDIREYGRILKQRNNLLKQISFRESLKDTLFLWDDKLSEYGKRIIKSRREFIYELNNIVNEISENLTGGRDRIEIIYEPNVSEDEFDERLRISMERDLKTFCTNIGPHKDDFCFINKDMDLRKYGSQGQQRTCAIALKLAEIEIIKRVTGHFPALLLDDVLSELDRNRQNYLLENIKDIQTVITCTGMEEFVDSNLSVDRVFKVEDGRVYSEDRYVV